MIHYQHMKEKVDPLAVSDLFIGAKNNLDMSRYTLEYKDGQFEQKSSGLVFATGTGATGWYDAIHKTIFRRSDFFPRDSQVVNIKEES